MALSAPLLTRKRGIKVSTETTKGTVATPTTDIRVYDDVIEAADTFQERKLSSKYLGHSVGTLEGTKAGKATFKTEIIGDGSSALDAGLAILLQACGMLKTVEVYTPSSVLSEHKTISLNAYRDGVLKQLLGCSGNVKIIQDGGRMVFDFDFSGVWQAPIAGALPTPSYSTQKPLQWGNASNAFTLATLGIKISSFEFDAGNNVVPRVDNGHIQYYMISDRDPTITIDPEFDLVAGYDLYGAWLAGTEVAISQAVTNGTDTMTIAAPKFQYREVKEGDRDGIRTDDVTGQCNMNSGDDDYSITIT